MKRSWMEREFDKYGRCYARCCGPEALDVVRREAQRLGANVTVDHLIEGDPNKGGYYAQLWIMPASA
jgi:hypothetical protein